MDLKVSICIPTYNQALFVEKAILSAVNQTHLPCEIIVSDDCSTDNTGEVLRKLAEEFPLLKVLTQPQNLGIAGNTDACLRAAKGDFIVRLDSDDYLKPTYSEVLLKLFKAFPNAGYAHGNVQEIDENGFFLKQRKLYRKVIFQEADEALKESVSGYRVAANIIMFKKVALEKVNFLANRPNFGEDYHLTASISAAGYGNVHSGQILSCYRVWVDQGHTRSKRKMAEIQGLRRVFEEVIEPAFVSRGWNIKSINDNRTKLARTHSDCLGWPNYNTEEKKDLAMEISQLSSAYSVRIISSMYLKGLGRIVDSYNFSFTLLKKLVKRIIVR